MASGEDQAIVLRRASSPLDATADRTASGNAESGSRGGSTRRQHTNEWIQVPSEQDGSAASGTSTASCVQKAHKVFAVTAVPTATLIGTFLFGLLIQARMDAHVVGRAIAVYCTVLSVVMTLLLVYLHLTAYTSPVQQRYIIRILLMVPIYAIDSCLALWNYKAAPIFDLVRDCYESYVIYNFFYLLMEYLGGEQRALQSKAGALIRHKFPLCMLSDFKLTLRTLRFWKVCLLQYMLLKPLMSVVAIVLMHHHLYEESSWHYTNAHVYFVFVLNVSVTLAFTCLVYFFVEFREQLEWINPVGKFAAVKAVVFLSFWQGVLMGLLVYSGFVTGSKEGLWTPDEVSTGVQDFLICLEMLVMCYVHHRVFPETPYLPASGPHRIRLWVILHALSVSDIRGNLHQVMVTPPLSERDDDDEPTVAEAPAAVREETLRT